MSTYCAPCLADLALVREAVTAVGGTAACTAHAVLLTHPGDNPQRRLTRLGDLRTVAEGKLADASPEDAPALELLVQEYALAGAMDMTVPLRDLAGDRSPRPPKARRNRPGRGDRPEGERHERPEGERHERPEGERHPRPEGERRERGPRPPRGDRRTDGAGVSAPEAGMHIPGAGPTSQDSAHAPVREPQAQDATTSPPDAPITPAPQPEVLPTTPTPSSAPDVPNTPAPTPGTPAPQPDPSPSTPAPQPQPGTPAPQPQPDPSPSTPAPQPDPAQPQPTPAPVQSAAPADSSLPPSDSSASSEL